MNDRTYAQWLEDDEDHRLRMCGLLPDERDEWERQDFESRHHDHPDLLFAPRAALTGAPWEDRREQAGTPLISSGVPAASLKSALPSTEGRQAAAGSSVITPPCPAVPPHDLNWEHFAWQSDGAIR